MAHPLPCSRAVYWQPRTCARHPPCLALPLHFQPSDPCPTPHTCSGPQDQGCAPPLGRVQARQQRRALWPQPAGAQLHLCHAGREDHGRECGDLDGESYCCRNCCPTRVCRACGQCVSPSILAPPLALCLSSLVLVQGGKTWTNLLFQSGFAYANGIDVSALASPLRSKAVF